MVLKSFETKTLPVFEQKEKNPRVADATTPLLKEWMKSKKESISAKRGIFLNCSGRLGIGIPGTDAYERAHSGLSRGVKKSDWTVIFSRTEAQPNPRKSLGT